MILSPLRHVLLPGVWTGPVNSNMMILQTDPVAFGAHVIAVNQWWKVHLLEYFYCLT